VHLLAAKIVTVNLSPPFFIRKKKRKKEKEKVIFYEFEKIPNDLF
jgi:hypothetical protein